MSKEEIKNFKFGQVITYVKDYDCFNKATDLTGDEFKGEILNAFPNYTCTLNKESGKYDQVLNENNKPILENKMFICIQEAAAEQPCIFVGIKDFYNQKYTLT